LEPGAA
jgi:hypothetical protein